MDYSTCIDRKSKNKKEEKVQQQKNRRKNTKRASEEPKNGKLAQVNENQMCSRRR